MSKKTSIINYDKDFNEKITDVCGNIHFKIMYAFCKGFKNEYLPWFKEKHIIKLIFGMELLTQEELEKEISMFSNNHIKEYSAVGLAFCYLFSQFPDIENPQCYNADGEGFDFKYKINGKKYKIEMSGVSAEKKTFTDRISAKRNKFKEQKYLTKNFEKEEIFIVDFKNQEYTYWDTMKTDNRKNKSRGKSND